MENNGNSLAELPLVLASGSPRRSELLRAIGIDPYILKPDCDETLHIELSPRQTVLALAFRKSLRARELLRGSEPFEDYVLLTCDTVVSLEGQILGKPKDESDAYRMLSALNGKMNRVYSGVCLWHRKSGHQTLFCDRSDVYFYRYGVQDIIAYIATKEPLDKAGGYAIQGGFAPYCEKVVGSRSNVIGLPTEMLTQVLHTGF